MNVLELKDVRKTYQEHVACNNISFEIPEGKIFGLLGPNGAGKTSLIRIITTITRADSGTILFRGEPLNNTHPAQIGYMAEERGLYKKMKVEEQITYLARLKGLTKKEAKNQLDYWLEKFNIQDWRNKKVEELSKGMQQKIQFITTVIHKPKLLILDEPFSGLDPVNANLIRDEIDELHKNGTTILFSTHRMEQVEQICEHIVLINKGTNVLSGSVASIKEQFKEFLFQVNYRGALPEQIEEHVTIISKDMGQVVVKLRDVEHANNFLKYLLHHGTVVTAFNEILPTLNEIFIKIVGGKSDE
ncbi:MULTISPECIES: ABC transporter ATP-binding protein [unclassified Aureispira]|uniref:ABC transporter ATP-binding protein n=1 Tax=unclassified Aureispira TaxID=2649989 RepID=UPI000695FF1F|nr:MULTISPECIES: ATP-binding cassette domain-containing protein [unclassified Aureispira]WMX14243.1 ATP-binding cassette domain-containing protein [Aureispira sp. CCB-E]